MLRLSAPISDSLAPRRQHVLIRLLLWCLALLATCPFALQAQDCNASTSDPAYNLACATCEGKAFWEQWNCGWDLPATNPAYQLCSQRVNERLLKCVASLPPAPPPPPPTPPAPAANPCVPELPMIAFSREPVAAGQTPYSAMQPMAAPPNSCTKATCACVVFLDPVPTQNGDPALMAPGSHLLEGTKVTTNKERLAKDGAAVGGIVADGAARVVIRIRADHPGQILTLSFVDDNQQYPSPQKDGQLSTIQGGLAGNTIQLVAQQTAQGPMAFAIYVAPNDFNRDNSGLNSHDYTLPSRYVVFTVQSTGFDDVTIPLNIFRPPIVLVAGLWDPGQSWGESGFTNYLLSNASWLPTPAPADFSASLAGRIVSPGTPPQGSGFPFPPILTPFWKFAPPREDSLGLDYSAPKFQKFIQQQIIIYRTHGGSLAAARADVVAHSMGGITTRWGERLPEFADARSFGKGNIHMLITFGTPHFGSPLPNWLFGDQCASSLFTSFGLAVLGASAVLQNPAVTTNGAIFDLAGSANGTGGGLSPNLQALNSCNETVPTALIAAQASDANLSGLTRSKQTLIDLLNGISCGGDSALLSQLTVTGWKQIFNNNPSDAIVPLASQLANQAGFTFPNTIHSGGLLKIFNGPVEMDPQSGIAAKVADLLNTPISSGVFFQCSGGAFHAAPAPGPPQ